MTTPPIRYDFRSDTVTRPSPAMRAAMANAEVGDDVLGDDPTVRRLEERIADLLGKSAALFAPSGTQSNLIALMAHCARGDEYLVGQNAHCYRWEAGGAAVLGSIQPQPLANQADGTLLLSDIEAAIKPDDPHFARTRLLALENTIGGKVLPSAYVDDATALARRHGLACHLDGARLFNAAVVQGVTAKQLAQPFDTVSVCLSKGLGAPVGSLLLGSADLVARARRWRKMLGGGMRQAGLLAAAGLHALEHHVERLAEDHDRARRLAQGFAELGRRHDGLLRADPPHTNIVFVQVDASIATPFADHLAARGVRAITSARYGMAHVQRWVTHLDVDDADVDAALAAAAAFFERRR